jgi:hypothetical protein
MRQLDGKGATNSSVEFEYRARSEVDKPKLTDLIKVSLTRPICECNIPVLLSLKTASDTSFAGLLFSVYHASWRLLLADIC